MGISHTALEAERDTFASGLFDDIIARKSAFEDDEEQHCDGDDGVYGDAYPDDMAGPASDQEAEEEEG